MGNINILDLPDDVLAKIFIKVDFRDLLNLTEACSRFNTIIGSNSQLMSRWMVRWWEHNLERFDIQSLLKSERKYQHLEVCDVKGIGPELEMFLTKHATSLNTIRFSRCSFKSSELGSALRELAENLRKLELCFCVEINVDSRIQPIQFKNLTHLNLEWDVSSSAFGFFTGAITVTDASLGHLKMTEINEISKFLQSLVGLTALKIVSLSPPPFSEDFNSMCRFRLRTLGLDFEGEPRMSQHFWKFIELQRSTLMTLRLRNLYIDRLDILLRLNLQELDLDYCKLTQNSNPLVENTSIKNLRIRQVRTETNDPDSILLSNLIRKCSRLEYIHASSISLTMHELSFETAFAIRNSNIKALDLNFCTFFPMPIPSLKKLHICLGNSNFTKAVQLLRLNPQLKDLQLPSGMSRDPKYAEAIEQMNLDRLVIY